MAWLSFSIRYGEFFAPTSWRLVLVLAAAPLVTVATLFWFGVYKFATNNMLRVLFNRIVAALGLDTGVGFNCFHVGRSRRPETCTAVVLSGGTASVWIGRLIAGLLLTASENRQLYPAALRSSPNFHGNLRRGQNWRHVDPSTRAFRQICPTGFVDRNPTLWRQIVAGYRVHNPSQLARTDTECRSSQVINRDRRRQPSRFAADCHRTQSF